MDLLRQIELENMKPETDVPDFGVGDLVKVHYLIREGDKERIQVFAGTVISITGSGIRRTALVRRMVAGEGVERIFPIHSPRVKTVEVAGRGKGRRARLFYLRDRIGKGVRLRQNFSKSRGPRAVPGTNPNPERTAALAAKKAKKSGQQQ